MSRRKKPRNRMGGRGPREIVMDPERGTLIRRRLKEISRCDVCNKRRFLWAVSDGVSIWREEHHRTHREAGACEAILFPPWAVDDYKPWHKKLLKELKWKWQTRKIQYETWKNRQDEDPPSQE